MKNILIFILFAVCCSGFSSAPDYRPKFDKSPYKGTVWTQVNPWWFPAKGRVDDSGGPNYARKKHYAAEQWGSAAADSYKYGRLNWQVELHVPAPGFANLMKEMMKQAQKLKVDTKFSIFLVYYAKGPKNLQKEIDATVRQLDMLKEEFKSSPSIFRVNGAPVISVYTPGYFKPEEWGKVIPAVEKKCGKFIWLLNTCRSPLADSDPVKGAAWVKRYIPYFDGVSQYGNYSSTSQQIHDKWLSELMHKEYPHKILELSCQNTYSNHFHFGGTPTKLSLKWRKSFDSVMAAKPDSIVMTNFFDHYENSMILPCYEREDFLLRYAEKRIADWRSESFRKEKTPELVVTNYASIQIGCQKLDFEVIGFPIESEHKKVTLTLDICNTAGKILHTFPEKEMDLTNLSVAEFSVPSEDFSKERGIVPRLRYKWNGKDYKMNYNPMTLISPSIRSYWMFWARSTKNALICNIAKEEWYLNETKAGGTALWQDDGIATFTAFVKPVRGKTARHGGGAVRIMRNGLEHYRTRNKQGDMNLTRSILIPSPADALNWYHMELENSAGNRYQTLPIWVTNNRRQGYVKMPILANKIIKEVEVEKAAVPYFYYPCNRDDGALLVDRAGYMHNGRMNGSGYGGGHLGYTGYYHYHNGAVAPMRNPVFARDKDGKGYLKYQGKEYILVMGGTAFPGAFTYEISIRPSRIGTKMGVLGTFYNQINVQVEPDGRLKAFRNGANIYSKTKLQAGEWYKIAVVYDLKKLKLYLNGKLEAQASAIPISYHGAMNHMSIGSLFRTLFKTCDYFYGDIREIRLYGRNLPESEFL